MVNLEKALSMTSRRWLFAIARERGLRYQSNTRKSSLVNGLSHSLIRSENLRTALNRLTEAEHTLIKTIHSAGGAVRLGHLLPQIRQLAPVRKVLRSGPECLSQLTSRQRRNPHFTILYQLRRLGFVFYDPNTDVIFIPTEFMSLVTAPADFMLQTKHILADASMVDSVTHDLACLLALLYRQEARPFARRWLPPRILRAWGERLTVSPTSPGARGELQTARRRFLHYLAENAGWLALSGPYLKPTPSAWLWINATSSARLQALWETWCAPGAGLWRDFRLPGGDWLARPDILLAEIHEGLKEMDVASPSRFASRLLARRPTLLDLVPVNALDGPEILTAAIADLLTGPFCWLGILQPIAATGDLALCLTSQGQAWITGQGSLENNHKGTKDNHKGTKDTKKNF